MPQKNSKKRKDVGKRKQNCEVESKDKTKIGGPSAKSGESLIAYFNADEIQEVKTVAKSKDMSSVPLLLAAVILNKFSMVKEMVQKGCNINETGPNHVTTLMWAVKSKSIETIEFLLANGADPTLKNNNGDNVLLLALENKIWDEENFTRFWNHVKNISFVDVDFKGKNGRNMLHLAVRREWTCVVDILLAEKANVNAANANGMTPLMLASYLNNSAIVCSLLKMKVDILKEDANSCTALCYAISHVIHKNGQIPHTVVESLIAALREQGMSFKEFFKVRIDRILNSTVKQNKSGQPVHDIKTAIIHYMAKFTNNGLKILLDENTFKKIPQALEKYINEPFNLIKVLHILNDIIQYCDRFVEEGGEVDFLLTFLTDGGADMILAILKRYESSSEFDFLAVAFLPLITICISLPEGKLWLHDNILDVLPFHQKYLTKNPISSTTTETINGKIIKFITLINMIQDDQMVCELEESIAPDSICNKNDSKEARSNSKKTKRRSKALKAKLAKIKSADLAERLNQSGKKILYQKCISDSLIVNKKEVEPEEPEPAPIPIPDTLDERFKPWNKHTAWEQVWLIENTANPLAGDLIRSLDVLKDHLVSHPQDDLFNIQFNFETECANVEEEQIKQEDTKNDEDISLYPDWKNRNLLCTDMCKSMKYRKKYKSCDPVENMSFTETANSDQMKNILDCTLNYLSDLMSKILESYKKAWQHTKQGSFKRYYAGNLDTVEKLEMELINSVQVHFNSLLTQIKISSNTHFVLCSRIIDKLEALLLNHKIREHSIMLDVPMQVVNMDNEFNENFDDSCTSEEEIGVPKYVECLLNHTRSYDDDTFSFEYPTEIGDSQKHPDELYLQEIMALPPKPPLNLNKQRRDKLKTMKHAYHLIDSIESLCNEDDDDLPSKQDEGPKDDGKCKKRQTLQQTLLAVPKSDKCSVLEGFESSCCSTRNLLMESSTSRWYNVIRSLQTLPRFHILLNGEVRVGEQDKDEIHTISTGGNFSPVVLGLDAHDRPLAVKRIRKENKVCKTMKKLLNPLLGLRNTNLLHYFSCSYEENDLILATPLCEYNMGEYIMIMKQSPNMYIKSIDIVRQFLAGLRFLHDRQEPIVHGNLKPSNIFVDLNGIVRVAEFGIHKALYTLTEAPNTSVIWFSRETLLVFNEIAQLECTCASDVQVAGMLIHFMLTAGKHPYGENMQEIIRNLEQAMPQLITNNVDLHDLISWMLLYEPIERPSISQVLSHVFFWTIERKWNFVLTCAGVSLHGIPLNIPLNELHTYINLVADKENIKGRWINTTKKRYPNLKYSKDDSDSITGLLKFIRNCLQHQVALHLSSTIEFRNFILTTFPALPLSLFRILESSQWLNHHCLMPFTTIESFSA